MNGPDITIGDKKMNTQFELSFNEMAYQVFLDVENGTLSYSDFLGLFTTQEEAAAVYEKFEIKIRDHRVIEA